MNVNQYAPILQRVENKIETGLGPTTDRLISNVLDNISKSNFGESIANKIIEPVTKIVNQKIRPYVYTCMALYAVIVFLLIVIILLLVKKNGFFKC